ncbi:MAG: fatty acid/phospholipid synthesis protein PlsX [Lachnospiraceae bacterium]|nr:fatty acid/phospholipid synthesis protein PlsX [Lachnospiraceae bacterium]
MELSTYFRSIIEQDKCSVVICNLEYEIIYMNPAAIAKYQKSDGDKLIGTSLLNCHNERSCELIKKVIAWFEESTEHNIIYTFHNTKENRDVYMVALRDENGTLIGYYEKHEYRDAETDTFYNFT